MAYGSFDHAPIEDGSIDWESLNAATTRDGLSIVFEPERRLLRMRLTHRDRFTFDVALLVAMRTVLDAVPRALGPSRPSVVLLESARDDVFSFGGDLEAFAGILASGDEAALRRYAAACIDVVHRVHRLCRQDIVSVAHVAGDALGGGLELALAADFIVAEPDARLALPERNFGSFPGMGAYSFLVRRVGRLPTERMIIRGEALSGAEAERIGLVDALGDGSGAEGFLRALSARPGTYLSVARARDAVPRQELDRIVGDWTVRMLGGSERDRRRIGSLARRQKARLAAAPAILPGGSAAMPPNPFR